MEFIETEKLEVQRWFAASLGSRVENSGDLGWLSLAARDFSTRDACEVRHCIAAYRLGWWLGFASKLRQAARISET
jgi:hypothetical protein